MFHFSVKSNFRKWVIITHAIKTFFFIYTNLTLKVKLLAQLTKKCAVRFSDTLDKEAVINCVCVFFL